MIKSRDENDQEQSIRLLGIDLIASAIYDLQTKRQGRKETIDWFNSRSHTPCGYGWALQVSGVNPNMIRKAIIKAVGKDLGEQII